ncbi:hypothetical protein BCR39DRAFT_132977 [Naematelia encephala]|uniref:Uncharacterized protein n=1 Tax=Naematelia encephala TaxID=71784 RepID=A0A1Y2BJ67_9TREE|nr:hypothetical protein BCR39DRAFT_132977 [Naematelia encephala]
MIYQVKNRSPCTVLITTQYAMTGTPSSRQGPRWATLNATESNNLPPSQTSVGSGGSRHSPIILSPELQGAPSLPEPLPVLSLSTSNAVPQTQTIPSTPSRNRSLEQTASLPRATSINIAPTPPTTPPAPSALSSAAQAAITPADTANQLPLDPTSRVTPSVQLRTSTPVAKPTPCQLRLLVQTSFLLSPRPLHQSSLRM